MLSRLGGYETRLSGTGRLFRAIAGVRTTFKKHSRWIPAGQICRFSKNQSQNATGQLPRPGRNPLRRIPLAALSPRLASGVSGEILPELLVWLGLLALGLIFIGCMKEGGEPDRGSFKVLRIDGCEYLEFPVGGYSSLTHKGNCTNRAAHALVIVVAPRVKEQQHGLRRDEL